MKKSSKFVVSFVAIIIFIVCFSFLPIRFDLTTEKIHTLSPQTLSIVEKIDSPMEICIYLDGNLPPQFLHFQSRIKEHLNNLRRFNSNINYKFEDPTDFDEKTCNEKFDYLQSIGLQARTINRKTADGSLSQVRVFPGGVVRYKERQTVVNLLSDNRVFSPEEILNSSIEELEYKFTSAISMISADTIPNIAFATGHGELSIYNEAFDFAVGLSEHYNVMPVKISDSLPNALDNYAALIIASPTEAFTEKEKFIIDNYLMRGGSILWMLTQNSLAVDSLFSLGSTFALSTTINLEDMLFTYGVRINNSLIQDLVSNPIPVTLSDGSSEPTLAPWLYYPLLMPSIEHAITKSLNPIWARYPVSMDTVSASADVKKTPLLMSSSHSRGRSIPCRITLSEVEQEIKQEAFNGEPKIVALLSEGVFQSVFRTRNPKQFFANAEQFQQSKPTAQIFIADQHIARNDVKQTVKGRLPAAPLGYDKFTGQTFGNKDFLLNCVMYLTDRENLSSLRLRSFQLRLLDKQKIKEYLPLLKFVNIAAPLILIAIFALIFIWLRKRRYAVANRVI